MKTQLIITDIEAFARRLEAHMASYGIVEVYYDQVCPRCDCDIASAVVSTLAQYCPECGKRVPRGPANLDSSFYHYTMEFLKNESKTKSIKC